MQQLFCSIIPEISQMQNFVLATVCSIAFGIVLTRADKYISNNLIK